MDNGCIGIIPLICVHVMLHYVIEPLWNTWKQCDQFLGVGASLPMYDPDRYISRQVKYSRRLSSRESEVARVK